MDIFTEGINNISKKFTETNKNVSLFKEEFNFESRNKEATEVLKKFPDRMPVIVEKSRLCHNVPIIDKRKYLVPNDINIGQFLWTIRKRLHLDQSNALFLFDEYGNVHQNTKLMSIVYEECKNDDKFLYLQYSSENTFGI